MASIPYDPSPTVGLDPAPPSDYQRDVGSAALKSVSQFGDTVSKVGDFYSKVALDDQFNQLEAKGNQLLYGATPESAGGVGGGAQPGYLTLSGKQAMDGRPGVEQSLDEWIKEAGGHFSSDEEKAAWNQRAEAYKNNFSRTVGSWADTQSKTWYGEVNKTSAGLALDRIAADPMNPDALKSGFADLQNAYIKNAQLAGATPGDEIWTAALHNASKDATLARIQAIGTTDPSQALTIAIKNKDILGSDFDNVYSSLRTAALDSSSDILTQKIFDGYASNNGSPVRPAGGPAGQPEWIDTYLANVKAQESGGNAAAKSATSSATGLYQFITPTWRGLMRDHPEAGLTEDGRTDPAQQEKAVRLFTADNAKVLASNRVPITPGNLYMAAFFGAHGAAALYDIPGGTPMEQAVGKDVLAANGWLKGKTVQDIRQWAANRAGKGIDTSAGGVGGVSAAPPETAQAAAAPVDVGHPDNVIQFPVQVPGANAAPAQVAPPQLPVGTASAKADMIQSVLDAPKPEGMSDRDWADMQHQTITKITQRLQYEQVAADQTAAAKKAANDQTANKYTTAMLSGQQVDPQAIAQDPNLTYETKISLSNALMAHADQSSTAALAAYGPGFWKAKQAILAPSDDPARISDIKQLLDRAAPGGDLTLAGVQKLSTIMGDLRKSNDNGAVQKAKASLEAYAKSKLSNQSDPNPLLNDPGHKDPIGEAAFNGTFVPKFEAAFDAWIGAGKDPWEFLTSAKADEMMQGIRDPQQVAMQKILGGIPEYAGPPAPQGVDEKAWQSIVEHVPAPFIGQNGQPTIDWPGILNVLVQNPTPTTMHYFDQKYGKGNGFTAKDVLDALGVEPGAAPAAQAAAPASPAQPAANPDYPGAHATVNGVEDLGLPMPGG